MKFRRPNIQQSNLIWDRAEKVIPAGTQTYSKGPKQFVMGVSPKYLDHGLGAHVWDVDGNEYIDFIMACQPVILGYCDPDVDHAIVEQLQKGITFSLMHPLEVDVAELLVETIPCAEGVRFGKNGADSTSAAVRIGRAVTCRDHVAYCGYHGWHDWYIANTDLNNGIPSFNQELTHSFTYNDLDSLESIFKRYSGQIACVIMEPVQVSPPEPGFLEGVKQITKHNGALLIFDEIITGFRYAEGGAQQLFGVEPDLACFAKAMSNGMPVSAVTGRKEYIQALETTFFSFTYGGECLSLAAAKATISKIKENCVINHLYDVGGKLQNGINDLVRNYGLEDTISCVGYACRSVMTYNDRHFNSGELKTYVQQEMAKRGVLYANYHSISYSHSHKDVIQTLETYEDILKFLGKLRASNSRLGSYLEGPVVEPVFKRVADFMAQQTNK